MSVLIKDLPQELKDLVKLRRQDKNQQLDCNMEYSEDSTVNSVLYWYHTPEGQDFWNAVHKGDIKEAKKFDCYPHPAQDTLNYPFF